MELIIPFSSRSAWVCVRVPRLSPASPSCVHAPHRAAPLRSEDAEDGFTPLAVRRSAASPAAYIRLPRLDCRPDWHWCAAYPGNTEWCARFPSLLFFPSPSRKETAAIPPHPYCRGSVRRVWTKIPNALRGMIIFKMRAVEYARARQFFFSSRRRSKSCGVKYPVFYF